MTRSAGGRGHGSQLRAPRAEPKLLPASPVGRATGKRSKDRKKGGVGEWGKEDRRRLEVCDGTGNGRPLLRGACAARGENAGRLRDSEMRKELDIRMG
jgi:hypothetical protein